MKQDKLLKILVPIVLVLLVFAVIGKKKGWFGKAVTVKVAVESVDLRNITEMITANGKIQPEKEVKISPDVSGEIVELNIREGDYVEKGTLLFRIKPDTYISMKERAMAALSSAQSRLTQAEAQFMQAELSFKRSKQLFDEQTISKADFEQAEASYKVAKAEVDAARFAIKSSEASLKEANENLVKTTVYAPIAGTISMLHVELGERVVGTEMMTGTEVLRIADLDRMEARVDVNENDIIKVKKGDTAIIEVDAYLGKKFTGIVTEIANSATTSGISADQVTNFDVRILILRESYADLLKGNVISPFRPGMSATVDIKTETRFSVVAVPIQSVTTRIDTAKASITGVKEEPRTIVFLSDGTYALEREVTTGIQDNAYIEVTTGVNSGESVVSSPFSAISKKLADSTLIEIVKKEDLFNTDKKKK